MKIPYVESSTVGEVAGKFSNASTTKDDAYQLAKGTGEVSNSSEKLSRIEYLRNKYGRFTPQELNHRINLRGAVEKRLKD